MSRLRFEYDLRKERGEKHPAILYVQAQAYDHMIAALRVVNSRLGLEAPPGELYSFKGMKLRRARENERG